MPLWRLLSTSLKTPKMRYHRRQTGRISPCSPAAGGGAIPQFISQTIRKNKNKNKKTSQNDDVLLKMVCFMCLPKKIQQSKNDKLTSSSELKSFPIPLQALLNSETSMEPPPSLSANTAGVNLLEIGENSREIEQKSSENRAKMEGIEQKWRKSRGNRAKMEGKSHQTC